MLTFLKLGGSMITHKDQQSAARPDVIARAATEIAEAKRVSPQLQIVLGHGSGSFGHFPAKKHNTRAGVRTEEQWHGFIEVWQQAAALNHIVMKALAGAGLAAMSFPPSASVSANDGAIASWDLSPLKQTLDHHIVPVIFGDVAFDRERGGTILSTEELFVYLAEQLKPERILLAGDEAGVYGDYQTKPKLIENLTPTSFPNVSASVRGAIAPDVTGGMAGKVGAMLDLVTRLPSCEVTIFSGLEPGSISKALSGETLGTVIKNS